MVKPKDVVIAISYSPYAREAVELVELGAKRGAQQIAITDSQVSRQPPSATSVSRGARSAGGRVPLAGGFDCLAQTLAVSLALE